MTGPSGTQRIALLFLCSILSRENASLAQSGSTEITIAEGTLEVEIHGRKLTIDKKRSFKLDAARIKSLKVKSVPKKLTRFSSSGTEIADAGDERVINEYLTYCDKKKQLQQVKAWLKNPNSGYLRLLTLYKSFFDRNKKRIAFSGNRVPLMILNKTLLEVIGRGTEEPLGTSEEVKDNVLLNGFLRAWHEKNSNE